LKSKNIKSLKNLVSILLLFFLSSAIYSPAFARFADEPFVLVLDAGHGGKDVGSMGKKSKEKDISLSVTLLVGKYIAEKHPDVKIVYTRNKDVFLELNERANIANSSKANLFISIHTNASEYLYVHGAEVYTFGLSRTKENLEVAKRENSVIYLEDNYTEKYEGYNPESPESFILLEFMQNKFVEQSINFASTVRNEIRPYLKWKDRGVKQAEYLVLRKSTMPRILIELDFITNTEAENFMMSENGQKKYARAICDAFTKYKADYDRKNKITQTTQPAPKENIITKDQMLAEIQPEETETEVKTTIFQSAKIASTNNTWNPPVSQSKKESKTPYNNNTIVVQQNKSQTAAPKTVSQTRQIVYKVQILATPKKLAANAKQLKGYKTDYYVENDLYKYTYGESTDMKKIAQIRKSLLKDFNDAFIIAFNNGIKVPIK
jgi:N-acetylmuramoyl-L-alanine amidase